MVDANVRRFNPLVGNPIYRVGAVYSPIGSSRSTLALSLVVLLAFASTRGYPILVAIMGAPTRRGTKWEGRWPTTTFSSQLPDIDRQRTSTLAASARDVTFAVTRYRGPRPPTAFTCLLGWFINLNPSCTRIDCERLVSRLDGVCHRAYCLLQVIPTSPPLEQHCYLPTIPKG